MPRLSERALSICPPPIDIITRRAAAMKRDGITVISLGQAICNLTPDQDLACMLAGQLTDEVINTYTFDEGLIALREMIASKCGNDYGVRINAGSEIMITAGANMAYMEAVLAIADPGEEIILPAPYYFDHEFAIRAAGCVPVISRMREENGRFLLDIDDISSKISPLTRAVTIVTPNNPTGAVFDIASLRALMGLLEERDLYLISDETYEGYSYLEAGFHSALELQPRENIIVAVSFSKTLSLAGMRIGYIVSNPTLQPELLKMQDAIVVCAPHISQIAAMHCLRNRDKHAAKRLEILRERRALVKEKLREMKFFKPVEIEGAFFAFPGYTRDIPSLDLALDILEKAHIALIHGSAFGPGGEGHLRISFGNLDTPELEEALGRLTQYFGQMGW